MKNKLLKLFKLGTCCIMVSVLISSYIPQKDTVALDANQKYKSVTTLRAEDPPFH